MLFGLKLSQHQMVIFYLALILEGCVQISAKPARTQLATFPLSISSRTKLHPKGANCMRFLCAFPEDVPDILQSLKIIILSPERCSILLSCSKDYAIRQR